MKNPSLFGIVAFLALGALAAPLEAQPDLLIRSVDVTGCDTVAITVTNGGDEPAVVTTAASFRAHPNGVADFGETYTKNVSFGEIAASGSLTRIVSGPAVPPTQQVLSADDTKPRIFTSDGLHTLTVRIDTENAVAESNEANNLRTTTHSAQGCVLAEPPSATLPSPGEPLPGTQPGSPSPGRRGCDLEATFGPPTGTSLPGGQPQVWRVRLRSAGRSGCPGAKVKLIRHADPRCFRNAVEVGGPAWQAFADLAANQSTSLAFPEDPTPRSGEYCYRLVYSQVYSDDDDGNHRPQRTVTFH